jgi:ankyrin repeat protein
MASATAGHESIARLLLEAGANPNMIYFRQGNALLAAIRNGHENVVRLLIGSGVNVHHYIGKSERLIDVTAVYGQESIVKILLAAGALCGKKTIRVAAQYSHVGVVNILKSHVSRTHGVNDLTSGSTLAFPDWDVDIKAGSPAGANISLMSGQGQGSQLAVAVRRRQTSIAEFLIDTNHDQTLDPSVLKEAVSGPEVDLELLRLLLRRLAAISNQASATFDPSSTAQFLADACAPALLSAVKLNLPLAVRELLQHGANVNAQDDRSYTALHQASEMGLEDLANILVREYHADVQAKLLNGSLPIHITAQYGSDKCIQFFLDQGVDVNTTNDELRTPLHTAVDNGEASSVRFLIAAGASLDLADENGMTAPDLAEYQLAEEQKPSHIWRPKVAQTILDNIVEAMKKQNPQASGVTLSQDSEQ